MSRLFNSLQFRLYMIFLVIALLLAAIVISNVLTAGEISREQDQIEVASFQRSNAYLLASLARRVVNADTEADRQSIISLMQDTMAGSEQFEHALHEGDASLGIEPITHQEIIPILDDLDSEWSEYRDLLNRFINAVPAERVALLVRIDNQSVVVFTFADRLSRGLELELESHIRFDQTLGAGLIAATIGAIGLSIAVVVQTVGSINRLAGTAHQIAAGDLTARASETTVNEIAEVGRVFNRMAEAVQQREADLRHLNEDLERRVDERTVELKAATAEAREASRLKDEFLSVMSHELRTPLNAILGYQGILELVGGFDDESMEMVQRTQANARRLLGLINDVLDISRIEAGRMELVPSHIEVRRFIDQVQSQMEVLAGEKGLAFNVVIDQSVPESILIDEDALSKIIVNLLGNAFKFTEAGEVHLNLSTDHSNMIIAVRDTGIGIPHYKQEVIFERFRQADSSSTRKHGGSGLGLSIVQQLCLLMNGKIIVESEPGKGSTFTVTLPLQPVTAATGVAA